MFTGTVFVAELKLPG